MNTLVFLAIVIAMLVAVANALVKRLADFPDNIVAGILLIVVIASVLFGGVNFK